MHFIYQIKEFALKHFFEVFGGALGTGSSITGMITGAITVSSDLHAVGLAIFTGAAGTLGALIIKAIWDWCFKK